VCIENDTSLPSVTAAAAAAALYHPRRIHFIPNPVEYKPEHIKEDRRQY
jgi:hypothetical protein